MNNFYIYYLRRPDKVDPLDPSKGQPFYVGKGCNGRISNHRIEANSLKHKPGIKMARIAIIHKLWKQGLDFEEEIYLDNLSEEDAFALEIAAIEQYGRIDLNTGCLANLTDGGEGMSGWIPTEETREKIRQFNLGKILSTETKEKLRQSKLGNSYPKGLIRSTETKEKLRQSKLGNSYNKGRACKEETKEKISKSLLGPKNPNFGNPPSKETREKISKSIKECWRRRKIEAEHACP